LVVAVVVEAVMDRRVQVRREVAAVVRADRLPELDPEHPVRLDKVMLVGTPVLTTVEDQAAVAARLVLVALMPDVQIMARPEAVATRQVYQDQVSVTLAVEVAVSDRELSDMDSVVAVMEMLAVRVERVQSIPAVEVAVVEDMVAMVVLA
jgi:hypothetical protein